MSEVLERLKAALADHYAFDREIGRGGMASVYLARDLKHKRDVAIKVLRPELAMAIGGERFLREIEIASGLNHPHILPLYDSGDADGALYFVMPFIEGDTLRGKIKREQQIAIPEAIHIASEIADALEYAHTRGVIHRDIKPENILLQGNHIFVADFGIALLVNALGPDRITRSGMSPGTPRYMSPEQASDSLRVDARTDVYSLGCVLYEMLTGEPPFTGINEQVVLAKKMYQPVPHVRVLRDTVSEALDDITQRALARTPADRIGSAGEFASALDRVSPGTGESAPKRVDADLDTGPGRSERRGSIRQSASMSLVRFGLAIMVLLLITTGIGFINTVVYDVRMEMPPEFTPSSYAFPIYGARALIPVAANLVFIFIGFLVAKYILRLTAVGARRIPPVRRLIERLVRRSSATLTKMRRSLQPVLASELHLILSIAVSVVVLRFYAPYLVALWTSDTNMLACAMRGVHRSFTSVMIALIATVGLTWYEIPHLTMRGGADAVSARLARWGGLAWLVILLFITTAPWRVVWNNERPRAMIENRRAYIIARSQTDMVVFDAERRTTVSYPIDHPDVRILPSTGYVFESDEAFSGEGPGC